MFFAIDFLQQIYYEIDLHPMKNEVPKIKGNLEKLKGKKCVSKTKLFSKKISDGFVTYLQKLFSMKRKRSNNFQG